MKKLGFNKKNWIALTLAAVLAVGGFGVHKALAAELIDETKQCSVTLTIPAEYNSGSQKVSNPISGYTGKINVKFYKVADMDIAGQLTPLNESGLTEDDIKSLQKESVSAETQESLAKKAYDNIANMTSKDVEFDLGETKSITKPLDRALYLCVPQDAQDNYYDYRFKYYLVAVPGSEAITATTVDENGNVVSAGGSDTWDYDVEILLKAEATPRYGKLEINKTLKTYNASLGTAAFVFDVEGYDGENNVVFSNVYTMNFDTHGSQKITIDKIPAGTKVVVTEVYSGASYTISSEEIQEGTIVADATESVSFVNDYDERLVVGGLSIENHFKKNEAGDGYEFVDSNISPAQNTIEGGQQ